MIMLSVVFTDWQGFEPSPLDSEYAEIGTFLAVDRRTVDQWIVSKARILTFQGGGWANLDDPKERFFDAKLRQIPSVEAFITAMRRARQAHPEIERIAAFTRSMTLEEAKSLKVPAGSRVMVPWDREVERWSIRGPTNPSPSVRLDALTGTSRFPSVGNIRLVKRLLNDTHSATDYRGETIFPVRQRAANLLKSWKVNSGL